VPATLATVDDQTLREALKFPLQRTDFEQLGNKYAGKVRDNYSAPDGRRFIIATDRISAFDRILGTLPLKGQLLNHVAAWWFDKTRDVAPNHVLSVPDPNVLVAAECTPLPVEMVVRAYLTGTTSTSVWVHYERGAREFCGHRLPDGMRKHQRLAKPLLTPSTKAAHGQHDISAAPAERGLILVDTKYEFGTLPDGTTVVMDEIHTPDSSRFWFSDSYESRFMAGQDPESFDKEYVRRFLAGEGFMGDGPIPDIPEEVRVEAARRYIEAVEQITGEPFRPDLQEPIARIRKSLSLS
jgi:phosphoribosylaminoimidazole-succinocarboxamide synthase